MDNNDQRMATAVGTWAVAALGSGIAWILLMLLGGWTFMQATFVAIIVFAILLVLALWVMRPLPAPGEIQPGAAPANPKPAAKTAPPKPAAAPAATTAAAPAAAPAVKPSPALSGQEDLAERKGEWKYEGDAAPAAKAPAKQPVAADGKPELFTAAQGDADDLKLISGVGPKLEGTLNGLGIWHFNQIASWRKKEVAWVDERLKFKGRIERDDWIGQAKTLAKGGETEFSKRKKK